MTTRQATLDTIAVNHSHDAHWHVSMMNKVQNT